MFISSKVEFFTVKVISQLLKEALELYQYEPISSKNTKKILNTNYMISDGQ